MSLKKIRLLVYLTTGLDPLNPDDSTYVDINVSPDEKLSKVHEVISTLLFLDSDEEYLYHRDKDTLVTNKILTSTISTSSSTSTSSSSSTSSPTTTTIDKDDTDLSLNVNKTLKELGVLNGETLFLELKPKDKRKRKRDLRAFKDEVDEDGVMQITCTTKLLNSDGEPYRKLRVLVHKDHLANYLMDDVSALWHKVALKFRVGRMVLSRDKTYRSLGIEDGAEVVVTGGRE